jgi:hypothetical protein
MTRLALAWFPVQFAAIAYVALTTYELAPLDSWAIAAAFFGFALVLPVAGASDELLGP